MIRIKWLSVKGFIHKVSVGKWNVVFHYFCSVTMLVCNGFAEILIFRKTEIF